MTTPKLVSQDNLSYYHGKIKAGFVAKEAGKGLSTNDYTDAEKAKVAASQANVIETVKVNGSALTVTDKTVDISVPTNTNQLTNGADFQTGTQVSTAISTAIAGVTQFDYEVVSTLPASGTKGTIYLVANTGESQNTYDEYLWINNAWEKLGTTQVDLSGYYTSAQVDNLLDAKANASTTYSKTEVDNLLDDKLDAADLVTLTTAEIDDIFAA